MRARERERVKWEVVGRSCVKENDSRQRRLPASATETSSQLTDNPKQFGHRDIPSRQLPPSVRVHFPLSLRLSPRTNSQCICAAMCIFIDYSVSFNFRIARGFCACLMEPKKTWIKYRRFDLWCKWVRGTWQENQFFIFSSQNKYFVAGFYCMLLMKNVNFMIYDKCCYTSHEDASHASYGLIKLRCEILAAICTLITLMTVVNTPRCC